jgi:hypothetical protein
MTKFSYYIVLIVFCLAGCKPSTESNIEDDIVEVEQGITISSIGEQLSADVKVLLTDWKDFQSVTKKIEAYMTTTSGQALENANDLSILIRKVSDTIKMDVLERPDFRARLNVLYSHSLRLDDMSTIPSISEDEVKEQVTKVLDAFSSINNKINAIYREEKSEKEFNDRSTKIDEIDKLDVEKDKNKSRKPSLVDPVQVSP